jgi:signal peptidase I
MSDSETQAATEERAEGWAPAPAPSRLDPEPPRPSLPARPKNTIFEVQSLLSITVIVLFAITFVVQAFRVPSESMEKTLLAGDFLLADKIHFAPGGGWWNRILPYESIRRGDIVVFRYPVDPSIYFVKRVIGVPGDHIRLLDKTVYLNGKALQESYAVHQLSDHDPYRDDFPRMESLPGSMDEHWQVDIWRYLNGRELVVPAGSYFVMGDNRDRSLDSRYWGFVPRGSIMGRPLVIYLSLRGLYADEDADSDGKLIPSGQLGAHFLQLARWNRMFQLVR